MNNHKRLLTTEQHQYLAQQYRHFSRAAVTDKLNTKFNTQFKKSQITNYIVNHKLKSGRTGQFTPGAKSWNYNTKGLTTRNRTTFKKGDIPANAKPLGHERICTKDGYILIKVAEPDPYTAAKTRYVFKHRHVWEQHHGEIPPGKLVGFIDGDKLNCHISNLELLTRAENAYLTATKTRQMPALLYPTSRLVAKLATIAAQKQQEQTL